MNISKNILKAINEGVYNALIFDKDELESSEEFDMQITSSKEAINDEIELLKKLYSLKLQEMMPTRDDIMFNTPDNFGDIIYLAVKWHKLYGATYKPVLEETEDFLLFVHKCIVVTSYDINLNWIDTSEITHMANLFKYYGFDGDISEWDVSNVNNMAGMFCGCDFDGDISKWNTSNVTNMYSMFSGNVYFNLDISNWDVSNVKNMSYMFAKATAFDLDLSKWKLNKRKVRVDGMFLDCPIAPLHKPKIK